MYTYSMYTYSTVHRRHDNIAASQVTESFSCMNTPSISRVLILNKAEVLPDSPTPLLFPSLVPVQGMSLHYVQPGAFISYSSIMSASLWER